MYTFAIYLKECGNSGSINLKDRAPLECSCQADQLRAILDA
jgi:hypothetical protein